jgi:Cytochrome P460
MRQAIASQRSQCDTFRMRLRTGFSLLLGTGLFCAVTLGQNGPTSTPDYSADRQLKFPENYRQWIYLSSGFDMSYNPGTEMNHHMFDNVFVNPEAYKAFRETGIWPDQTMLVLEVRAAEGKGSINQKGSYQSTETTGIEVHVRDSKRFAGGWAFFGFDGGKTAKMVPLEAACYSCHRAHGAVDTTFVQFYPTLLPIAKSKGTLSSAYRQEGALEK